MRWLAKVPLFPALFDAALLAGTVVFHHRRIAAMEALEAEARRLPNVKTKVHRFGGIEFVLPDGRELGHLHGHGLLDVRVKKAVREALLKEGRVRRHHVFPASGWISFQLEEPADVAFALQLLRTGWQGRWR